MLENRMGPCVAISWHEATEYVPIHPDRKPHDPFFTFERWTGTSNRAGRWVAYRPTWKLTPGKDAETVTYVLRYRPNENPDLSQEPGVRWGVSTITINLRTRRARAKWEDDHDPDDWNATCGARLIDVKPRTRGVSRPNLRNQEPLRAALLDILGSCPITGETTPSALEVAHIVSVEAGGPDWPTNALLLRADLHRLFDAGDFRIDPKGRIVGLSPRLSTSYREMLTGARLDEKIVARVKAALLECQSMRAG